MADAEVPTVNFSQEGAQIVLTEQDPLVIFQEVEGTVIFTDLDTSDGPPTLVQYSTETSVVFLDAGLQGPRGEKGERGEGSVVVLEHMEDIPSAEWIFNHNLGYKPPTVQVTDLGNAVVEADIRHVSDNQLRVYFASPFRGYVRVIG